MDDNLSLLFMKIDSSVVQGNSGEARRLLFQAKFAPFGRNELLELATLYKRAGLPHETIRILNPWVRPKARAPQEATDPEKAEYADALTLIGADREGTILLNSVGEEKVPQAWLYGAYSRFSRWEYAGAIPLLKKYLNHPVVSEYQKRVAQVNLLAALTITENFEESNPWSAKLIQELKEKNQFLLLGNTLEILSQKLIAQRKFREAEKTLQEASKALSEVLGAEALFVEKWKALLALTEKGISPKTLALLGKVRDRAREIGHWETLRDCDFHLAAITRNQQLMAHVYSGTPFSSYRERIRRKSGEHLLQLKHHYWRHRVSFHGKFFTLDTRTGKSIDPSSSLKVGQAQQRLLQILVSDFYRPHRLAALFGALHPDRHYHPTSSPEVVHQTLRRLRSWISRHSIPLEISEEKGSYRLRPLENIILKVYMSCDDPELNQTRHRVRELHSQSSFSTEEAAKIWNVSKRSAGYYLEAARKAGLIEQNGRGPKTRYNVV